MIITIKQKLLIMQKLMPKIYLYTLSPDITEIMTKNYRIKWLLSVLSFKMDISKKNHENKISNTSQK